MYTVPLLGSGRFSYENIVHYNKGLSLFDSSYVFYYRWRFSAKCIEQLIQSKKDIQILTKD